LIGVAGNQSLGFVTRKREIALLHSVAMPRKKLCRLLFLESLFSMGISAFFAIIAAPFLFNVLGHLFALFSDGDISILEKGSVDTSMMFAYLLIMLSIYLLTTLSPVKQLRKMNMSEELKYE
jgi:ABC-type antimicrobial peptide transport system permease subunit